MTPGPVTITRLGHRGDGIAAGPGAPIYAPRTLPGEVVDGPRDGDRIPRPRILTPSPDRVRPPCPHTATCGGCALQHAAEAFTTRWKEDQVRRALAAQGLEARFAPTHTSPPHSRRRATFALKRTKSGALVGFHAPASHTVTDTPHCLLIHPALAAARPALAEIAVRCGTRKGTLSATLTRVAGGLDLAIAGAPPPEPALRAELAGIARAHRILRLTWADETLAQEAPPRLLLDGIAVTPPPGAFLQATAEGEASLRAAVLRATEGAARIADLFAGIGTFALPLARHAEVHAVEGDAAMTGALAAAGRHADGLRPLTTETRDLFRRPLLPDELARYDAVVIDPPRAGAAAQTAALAETRIPRIAAISCNPATFARDAAVLTGAGYRLDWVQVVDQFRWSTHVELAACFSRRHIAPKDRPGRGKGQDT